MWQLIKHHNQVWGEWLDDHIVVFAVGTLVFGAAIAALTGLIFGDLSIANVALVAGSVTVAIVITTPLRRRKRERLRREGRLPARKQT